MLAHNTPFPFFKFSVSKQLLIGIRNHVQIHLVLDLLPRLMLSITSKKQKNCVPKLVTYRITNFVCYWEFETDILAFQPEIERFNKFRSRSNKLASMKQRSSVKDDVELKN
ncbi:uncharacterized protein LOC107628351 [Arachis ipaensis]|uniref:uncharacterized protein LOC107628351 n=1 Tax=Arachis ipaensis TaxID=130454 RepID=UPI000A2B4B3D|nr:uncharacterized protein LOC107628351 [Arachis ipaensis]